MARTSKPNPPSAEPDREPQATRPRRKRRRSGGAAPISAPSPQDEPSEPTAPASPPRKRQRPAPRRRSPAQARAAKVAKLRERLTKLQAELAELTESVEESAPAAPPEPDAASAPPADDLQALAEGDKPWQATEQPAGGTHELLTSDYFMRQWGRLGLRRRSEELDDFGLDDKYEARLRPLLHLMYTSYFRVEVEGIQQVPSSGRCLVVANHSGGPVPYDGLLLRTTLRREHPNKRELRWLAEDFFHHLPFIGTFMTRLGAVRACQENAQRLLHQGNVVAVFPEGAKGIGKRYRSRYRLQRFGRGGFIRLCLRTHTPLIPCAIVGAEEANPMLARFDYMTRFLRVPYVPITPTFPWLGPVGLMPAPTKIALRFGDPIYFDGYDAHAADDAILVRRLTDRVRATIQAMVDEMLAKRQSVFFG